jgi:NAD(P)-dependent dehydrogenase (short-subunit alcohol dehydrogenase family)
MRVFILGGTSGIGLALAKHYVQQGHTVAIAGRDPSRVPVELAHSPLQCVTLDVRDKDQVSTALVTFAQQGLDLLVVAAGVYVSARREKLTREASLQMLSTNVSGLANAFDAAASIMLKQPGGHLVAIASIAGLLKDYPGASLYAATKRSVLSLCDAYRVGLAPFGVVVSAIAPGYIDTAKLRELNQGDASKKLWIISEQEAVNRIAQAISDKRALTVFPKPMHYLVSAASVLPSFLLKLRR